MTRHLELGRCAEDRAEAYIRRSPGWKVLGRNLVNPYGELDIVALDGGELVIVEVRCRTLGEVQSPLDSVGPRKLRHLVNAGRAHADRMGWTGPWRIDLIAITVDRDAAESEWRLEHVRDVTRGLDCPS
ncbi:MAG: YraN family protein [Fretibacterium sp.]